MNRYRIGEDNRIRMIDENKDSSNTNDIDNDAKTNEIEETLENASDKVVAESKKEAKQIGDSDRE